MPRQDRLTPELQMAGHRLDGLATMVAQVTPETGTLALALNVIGTRPEGRNPLPRRTWAGLLECLLGAVETDNVLVTWEAGELVTQAIGRRHYLRALAGVIRSLLLAASWIVAHQPDGAETELDDAEEAFTALAEAAELGDPVEIRELLASRMAG